VVRDLMRWKQQSGLSFEESMLLKRASNYLANELATVQGIPTEAAIDRIRSHVEICAA
jgi:RNA polymerase-interacting CarD/CdnL/TRCF family regulator